MKKLMDNTINLDEQMDKIGYQPRTIEEFLTAMIDYPFFYEQNEAFLEWAYDRIMKK